MNWHRSKKAYRRYRWECGFHQEFGEWFALESDARSQFWSNHTGRDCPMGEVAILGKLISTPKGEGE